MKFKQFEIKKPIMLIEPEDEDYYKYNFDIVKLDDGLVIGTLEWIKYEHDFNFKSVGTRYLEYREDGLEEWLLKWCELKIIEYKYEEEDI